MLDMLFGNHFDYNRDGQMDDFEKRAAFTAYLDSLSRDKYEGRSFFDLSRDEQDELAAESGVDPSPFGY